MNRNRPSALLTLLSTGALSLSCALAASAQDNSTPATPAAPAVQQNQNSTDMSADASARRSRRSHRDRSMSADHRMDNDAEANDMDADDIDPMPISYPFAAPGAVNMYHFHTYGGLNLRPGSVTEARYQHQRDKDDMRMKTTGDIRLDEDDVDPMPIGYPFAAPGAIDLYHFHSYNGLTLETGSASDTRYWKMRNKDKKRMDSMPNAASGAMMNSSDRSSMEMARANDMDEDDVDPMPIGYPFAAPGAIDLYHFHSYAGLTLETGSATDTRYSKMRDQDMKRIQMQQNRTMNGSTNNP